MRTKTVFEKSIDEEIKELFSGLDGWRISFQTTCVGDRYEKYVLSSRIGKWQPKGQLDFPRRQLREIKRPQGHL